MQKVGDRLVLSPSDLNDFLECEHKTSIKVRRCLGGLEVERVESPEAEILWRQGIAHERSWLERFKNNGRAVVEIRPPDEDWNAAADQTLDAMRAGAQVIYQAVFVDTDSRGIADFLVRVDASSLLGSWSYEAWDTKLARTAKPAYVFQLAFYSAQIERIMGHRPEFMHVVLGTNEAERLRTDDFLAYYRAVRRRFQRFVAEEPATYPYPIAHCSRCPFEASCDEQWRRDDHLSLVARIRRDQVMRLESVGVTTVRGLAGAEHLPELRIATATLDGLRGQARLQAEFIDTGVHTYDLLPPKEERGFALLPQPSPGDLFFDMEGDPYFEQAGGLEYLFGVAWMDGAAPKYRAWWAKTRQEEARAFEDVIDFLRDRLRSDPGLHVYHYASYERSKLGTLAQQHSTREEELDDLLRRDVFVDLYRVVRQTLRTSHEGYSLKDVRQFFMEDAGAGTVATAGDSIVEFERWRQTGDDTILDPIERYNEEDCVSTLELRDWLLLRKAEAEAKFRMTIAWRPLSKIASEPVSYPEDRNAGLRAKLMMADDGTTAGEARRVLAGLLDYHRREDKPEWWAFFDRFESSMQELMDDAEAIAGLVPAGAVIAPIGRAKSPTHVFAFPPQEYKLADGDKPMDFGTRESAGTLVGMDHELRRLGLKRGPRLAATPLPTAIVAGKPHDSGEQREAVHRVADYFSETGIAPATHWTAVADLLLRNPPRIRGGETGGRVQTLDLDEQVALVRELDGSCLVIQGPPGSGKTWTGARLAASLLQDGKRVGVAAFSHRAIHNFLEELERVAAERGLRFNGVKKATGGRPDSHFDSANIRSEESLDDCMDPSIQFLAGTTFCFAPLKLDDAVEYLFIDEAGQLSLGDAVAMGTATRNLVLLGDPQQLPHVSHGVHPEGVGLSVLEYYMNGQSVIPADRGIFLARTFRMHPDLCRFVSALSYERKLGAHESCANQVVRSSGLSGNGTRFIPVPHVGNAQMSEEEAAVVVDEVTRLLADGWFVDQHGEGRRLVPSDILVVAPYNMHVRCLRERMPAGVQVGTVDKFQGREAPVVFYSMATSSGEDMPRNMGFLFSRNRLNVALSRARCLAVVVASPRLLEVDCNSIDDMRLVNGLCRLAEESGQ